MIESLEDEIYELEVRVQELTSELAELPDAWNGKIVLEGTKTDISLEELARYWNTKSDPEHSSDPHVYGFFYEDGTFVTGLEGKGFEHWIAEELEKLDLGDYGCDSHTPESILQAIPEVLADLRYYCLDSLASAQNELACRQDEADRHTASQR